MENKRFANRHHQYRILQQREKERRENHRAPFSLIRICSSSSSSSLRKETFDKKDQLSKLCRLLTFFASSFFLLSASSYMIFGIIELVYLFSQSVISRDKLSISRIQIPKQHNSDHPENSFRSTRFRRKICSLFLFVEPSRDDRVDDKTIFVSFQRRKTKSHRNNAIDSQFDFKFLELETFSNSSPRAQLERQ